MAGRSSTYPKVPVTVTTPYRMHVEPAGPVKPGTVLTVTSVGGGCPGIWAPVVNLWSSSTRPPDLPTPDAVYGQTGGGPTWTLVLPVPVGTVPGQYDVVGRCSYSRSFPGDLRAGASPRDGGLINSTGVEAGNHVGESCASRPANRCLLWPADMGMLVGHERMFAPGRGPAAGRGGHQRRRRWPRS